MLRLPAAQAVESAEFGELQGRQTGRLQQHSSLDESLGCNPLSADFAKPGRLQVTKIVILTRCTCLNNSFRLELRVAVNI
jgi:hypothetical protein